MSAPQYIDLYCERTAPGFWNEPVNALSNLAFLIAAFLALRIALGRDRRDWPEIFVILLAGAVGIGSFLFHTLANSWSELADVVPIWSLVAAYVLLIIYRSSNHDLAKTARIATVAAGITGAILWFTSGDMLTDAGSSPGPFNGSLQYAPALAALAVFSLVTMAQRHPARHYILSACGVFLVSLIMRSLDLRLCAATGIGTHFLWHLLNAAMIGLLLQALVHEFPPAGGATSTSCRHG